MEARLFRCVVFIADSISVDCSHAFLLPECLIWLSVTVLTGSERNHSEDRELVS